MDNYGCNISNEDREFLILAGNAGLLEVKLAQLAISKTSNAKIAAFAKMMVDERSRFNEEFIHMLKRIHEKVSFLL